MGYSLVVLAALLGSGVLALRGFQSQRLRRISMQRAGLSFEEDSPVISQFFPSLPSTRTYPARYRFAAFLAGGLTAAFIVLGTRWPRQYAVSLGILVTVIAYLLEEHWTASRIQQIEAQLADSIDLMIASIRAGSALLTALEAALSEAHAPLRGELENIVGRIRLGEDPRNVIRDLAVRVPFESFRLFAHSLLVHWETGGSLATSLRTVSRTIRDRVEVSRRISAQAVEAQVSVVAVMCIAYGLTILRLSTNPVQTKKLLYSQFGAYVGAGVMILQAIGIGWIWRMSRIRF
jgi:tight adherence protein B